MDATTLDSVPATPEEVPVEAASRGVGLSSGVIFLISLAIQLIGYVSTYFFAQGLGHDDQGKALLGLTQFYLLVASSLNGIGDLRIGAAYTFFISRGKPPESSTATYLLLRLLMVGVAGATLWVLGPSLGLTSTTLRLEMFGIFLLLPLLWSFSTVYTQLTQAQGRSIRSQYPLLLESIIRTGVLVIVATHHPTIVTITLAYVPGAIVSTLYCAPTVFRNYARFSWAEGKGLFRFAWPLMGSLILTYIAGNAVSVLVLGDSGTVALNLFNAANGYRIVALAVPAAVITPLFPSLTSMHARGLLARVRLQTWQALRFTAMAVVPGALALVVYRVDFLNIMYHGTYAPAAPALAILALSAIPTSLQMIIGTALNSIRMQRLELYLTVAQVAVLFAVAFLLLPPVALLAGYGIDGLLGASIALLSSAIAAFAVNTYFLEKYVKVRIAYRPIATIGLAAAVSFYAVSRFNVLVNVHHFWQLIPGIVIGFTVYFVFLAAVGELSKGDIRQVGGMVRVPDRLLGMVARLCWRETTAAPDESYPSDPPPRA